MILYDTLRCHCPLPVAGANALAFQTKSTPAQFFDDYEIRADGTLWHQAYVLEDRSDPQATGVNRLAGAATRVNPRWEHEPMTGELRFYTSMDGAWLEFVAEMVSGRMVALTPIAPPGPRQVVDDTAQNSEAVSPVNLTVHCLVEFDPTQGQFLGRIIGFPHIELLGSSIDAVEARLRQTVASLVETEALVLETNFVALMAVSARAS